MQGYQDDDGTHRRRSTGAVYRTGDVAIARRGRLHHLCRPRRRRVQSLRLSHQPVRARERADRASGGGRGGGGAGARSGAARGAQGLRHPGRRGVQPDREHGAVDLPAPARAAWRRSSACGGSSSPICRRRSPARSAAWSCGGRRRRWPPRARRAAGEFREEDFPELKQGAPE